MCTIIAIGSGATSDGSIIVSHSDAGKDSRIRKIPRQQYRKGAMAPVYYGLQEIRSNDLEDYGEIIGYIPQVEETFSYFHSAYSHTNEYQLTIAESTMTQRKELVTSKATCEQIMSIEQAMIFALQRCKKAREAIALIGTLMETYGFLSTCVDGGECLCIADPDEIWIMEIVGVGGSWRKHTTDPGAIWVAQRMPSDHALIVANWSIIREIKIDQPDNFITCKHYISFAVERGWFKEDIKKEFIWQEIYFPITHEGSISRLWLFYSTIAPSYYPWPEKGIGKNRYKTLDPYTQCMESLSIYPFSVRPQLKISLKDVMKFQRSVFEDTIYDITEQPQWYILNEKGEMEKSAMATPFPSPNLKKLLRLTNRRTVARHVGNYGMICQIRKNVPVEIGNIYWVYLDNPHISPYLPFFTGSEHIPSSIYTYNPEEYSDESARWCIDFVDNLVQLEYQNAINDVKIHRDLFEKEVSEALAEIDHELLLVQNQPERIKRINEFNLKYLSSIPDLYIRIRNSLIVKYTNNRH